MMNFVSFSFTPASSHSKPGCTFTDSDLRSTKQPFHLLLSCHYAGCFQGSLITVPRHARWPVSEG